MINKIIIKNFNKKIMIERKKWGMSRKKLAKKISSDEDTIRELEQGIYKNLNLNTIVNLSIALQISFFEFLRDDLTVKELKSVMRKENFFV